MMSLKQSATSGVKWTGSSATITTGLQFLQLFFLARLLVPEDFGLMAMITVVIGFARAFADMGVSNAIIYRQDATRDQLSSLYWLNMFTGVVIFSLVWAATPLVVGFYSEPRLADLMFWAALIFLIVPIGQQFQILLQKELKFDRLAKVEIASIAIGTVVAISSAIAGQGVFSLIWGQLASSALKAVSLAGLGWTTWRPALRFRSSDLKNYIGFGLYQMGERSVNYFSANVDYLVIGRFLGPEMLGIYTLAYQLVVMPLSRINPILTRVAFPVFAKKQSDNAALRRGYLEMIKLLALVVFPILIGLGVTAQLVVPVVFGEGWTSAIPLIQILALLGMLKVIGNPSGSILLAKGRADIGFKWNVFVAITNTLVFWYVVQYGVYMVAWSYVILCIVYFIFGRMILYSVIGLGLSEYLNVLIGPTIMSAFMGAAVFTAYIFLGEVSISRFPMLFGLIAFGIVVYGLMLIVLEQKFIVELWKLVINKKQEVQQCQGL